MIKYSIIIPLWNKKNTIIRAINSAIKASSGYLVEIIVVNDGSTDGSDKLVSKIYGPSVKLINQSNCGVSRARNLGVRSSSGRYILFLDADDEWCFEHLTEIDLLIKSYPCASLYGTAYQRFGSEEIILPDFFGVPTSKGEIESYFLSMAYGAMPISSSSACVPRAIFDNIGGFQENVTHGEDRIFWAEASLIGKVAWSSKITSTYFLDAENRSSLSWKPSSAESYLKYLLSLKNKIRKSCTKVCVKDICENIYSESYFLGRLAASNGYKLFSLRMSLFLICHKQTRPACIWYVHFFLV